MRKILAVTVLVLSSSGIYSPAAAQQAINSATGVALFPGGSVVRSRIETRSLSRDDGTKDVDVYRVPTTLSYGITPDLTLGAALPYVRKDIATRSGATTTETTIDGLADIFLTAKYRYFHKNYRGGSTQLAMLGGVKFPTGQTDDKDSSGALLPMGDQLDIPKPTLDFRF